MYMRILFRNSNINIIIIVDMIIIVDDYNSTKAGSMKKKTWFNGLNL